MITISEYGTSLFQFVGFCVVFPKKTHQIRLQKDLLSTPGDSRIVVHIYIYRVYIIVYLRILICRLI